MFMCELRYSMEDRVLTLEVQNHPHVTVLRCAGRIVHGDGADALIRAVMSQDQRNLQIDLCDVDTIDASGLGALVTLEKWAKERDRTVQIVNPSKRVREAIETTKLSSVLQIVPATHEQSTAA